MCEVMGKGKMRANGLSKVKEGLGGKKKLLNPRPTA